MDKYRSSRALVTYGIFSFVASSKLEPSPPKRYTKHISKYFQDISNISQIGYTSIHFRYIFKHTFCIFCLAYFCILLLPIYQQRIDGEPCTNATGSRAKASGPSAADLAFLTRPKGSTLEDQINH